MAKATKKQDTAKLTYNGDLDQVTLGDGRYVLARGEATEVDMDTAKRFADNPYFDASGVSADDPASGVSAEDALAAERAAHAAELEAAKADFAKQLQDNADALKAGWKEQHDALVAENESLKAQLAGTQQPQGQ